MNRFIFPLIYLLLTPFLLMGQDDSESETTSSNLTAKAIIVYAEGKGFTISRGNITDYVTIKSTDLKGYELKAGDLINVEKKTVLEIQIYPSGTRLRVSESSTFRLGNVNEDGSGNVEVLYGSVRTQSDKNLTDGAISLKGLQTVNAAKGADFELEMVYNTESTELLNRVYCLEGKVEVIPTSSGDSSGKAADKVVLKAREMLTIKNDQSTTATENGQGTASQIEKETIPSDVIASLQETSQFKADEEVSQNEATDKGAATSDTEETEAGPEEKIVRRPMQDINKPFWLGFGGELSFMLIGASNLTTANPLQDGLFAITNPLDFLLFLRCGPMVDGLFAFNPVVAVGLEIGVLYSTIEINSIQINLINVPALLVLSLTPGPLFIQFGAGLACIGYIASFKDPLTNTTSYAADLPLYYEAHFKLGFKIENLIIYAGGITDFRSLDKLLNARLDIRINLGASWRI